jgi:hypothetical protein
MRQQTVEPSTPSISRQLLKAGTTHLSRTLPRLSENGMTRNFERRSSHYSSTLPINPTSDSLKEKELGIDFGNSTLTFYPITTHLSDNCLPSDTHPLNPPRRLNRQWPRDLLPGPVNKVKSDTIW